MNRAGYMNGYLSKSAKSEDFYPFGRMPKDMQVGLKTPESPIPIKSEGPLTVRVDPSCCNRWLGWRHSWRHPFFGHRCSIG
jgi:hypothetical protein